MANEQAENTGPAKVAADFVPQEMTGTESQLQWATQIRRNVALEFDHVAQVFYAAAGRQSEPDRAETHAVIAILEEKRSEVMANDRAGYFIRDWQELNGRVREMIAQDPRYRAIRVSREERRRRADSHSLPPREAVDSDRSKGRT